MATLPHLQRAEGEAQIGAEIAPLLALAPPGKIVELSGQARTSLAARLLRAVQAEGDPVAWITPQKNGGLFPPDLAAAGLDLDALVVVHVPEDDRAGPKAAELLLRTGAFGAVALDARALGARSRVQGQRATAWQGRLSGILRTHAARLLVLTDGGALEQEAGAPSLGPLIGVRLVLARERRGDQLWIETHVVKDKSGALGGREPASEEWRGPAGSAAIEERMAPRPRLVRVR